jgi:hypothetical protein
MNLALGAGESDATLGTASATGSILDGSFSDPNESASTPEETPISGNVISNSSPSTNGPIVLTGFIVHGLLDSNNAIPVFTAGQTAAIPGVGTITIAANGAYTFTPVANFNGTVPTVTYSLVNDAGVTFGDTSTLAITVTPVNDAPVDGDELNRVTQGVTLTVAANDRGGLLRNYSDIDSLLPPIIDSYTIAGIAGVQMVGAPVTIDGVGVLTINSDGSYQFVPVAGYNGLIPVATYTVDDGNGGTDTSTLTLTISRPILGNVRPSAPSSDRDEVPPTVLSPSRVIGHHPFIHKPFEHPPIEMGRYEYNVVALDFNGVHGGINQFALPQVESTAIRGNLGYSNSTPYTYFDRVGDEVENAQRPSKMNAIFSSEDVGGLRNPILPPDAKVGPNGKASYILPPSTFVGGKGDVTLTAVMMDGKPLPAWIRFNPANGRFDISMPQDMMEPIEIQIIGTDAKGDQAKTKLNIKPPEKDAQKSSFVGKSSFTSQIRSVITLGRG